MKRLVLVLVVAGMIQSCSDKNKLPRDILPQPKMQAVLWDLIRAGNFLNNYVYYKGVNIDQVAESEKWNEKIFEMHKITRVQFVKSYAYYQQHPQQMKAMMDSIGKIKVEQPVQKPAMDSLKKDSVKKKADSLRINKRMERFRKLGVKKSPSL